MPEAAPEESDAAASWIFVALAVLFVTVMAIAYEPARRLWRIHQQIELGDRLLRGVGTVSVLQGRRAGDAARLPPQATRCIRCHATETESDAPPGTFAPLLNADMLVRPISRRGGPPSRYDAASLCRLLREGVDPAGVVIDATMPHYEVSDAQCEALWRRVARVPFS